MKIVLFGNSRFALPSLHALAQSSMLAGLCTTDAADEETLKIQWMCKQAGVPLLAINRQEMDTKLPAWLREINPDVAFVLTFSYKLPPSILAIPPMGFFNFHFAKLPEYRGPQPIFWEFVNGEKEGAVAVHKMDDKFDSGPLAIMEKVPILPTDTYGIHVSKVSFCAIGVMQRLIERLADPNGLSLAEQDHDRAAYYKRPGETDVIVDWENFDSSRINALVKACNPWNKGAFSATGQLFLRILDVSFSSFPVQEKALPGEVISVAPDGIHVACRDRKALKIDIIYMDEGFLPGSRLLELGVKKGDLFIKPQKG